MDPSSETFQAETSMRRESGSVRSVSMSPAIWSIAPPSRVGQERHCEP